MAIGLTRDELKAQCKDLIFAGTDSTGHNVASMCRYLAMHPSKYVLSMVHSTITTNSNEIQVPKTPGRNPSQRPCPS
jgi:hypothetical protein